jgi:hypothetical protein
MKRAIGAVLPLLLAAAGCSAVPVETTSPSTTAPAIPSVTPASAASDLAPHPGPRVERAADQTAAQFIHGYLRLTYHQGNAPHTVTALVGAPPDVPIAIRKHHPRVTRITFDWTSLSAATAVATIRDGRASYPVTLRLARRGGAFHVVGLDP